MSAHVACVLDYGFVSPLGTSLNWATFVITLHAVWSIGSAIAIAEGLSGRRWDVAWLGTRGLLTAGVVFLLGCLMTTATTFFQFPFVASAGQFAAAGALVVTAAAVAFAIPDAGRPRAGQAPSLWTVGVFSFALSSGFHLLFDRGNGQQLTAPLTLAGMLALEVVAVAALLVWSRRDGWTPRHPLAAATGAVLTYGWVGYARLVLGGETALGVPVTGADDLGQAVLLIGVMGLIALAARRLPSGEMPQAA